MTCKAHTELAEWVEVGPMACVRANHCDRACQYPAAWPSFRDSDAPMYTSFSAS